FRSVSTSAARYQQLSLNPLKLAGQCGKLKCCLNYELDAYLDALKDFPKTDTKLYTEKGTAVCQKTDIFRGFMWFAYEGEWMNWHKLTTDQANEIIALNKKKEKVTSLEDYASELIEDVKSDFENVVGQDSLTRFDTPKRKSKRRNTKSKTKKPAQAKQNAEQPAAQKIEVKKETNNEVRTEARTVKKKRRKPNPKKSNPNNGE